MIDKATDRIFSWDFIMVFIAAGMIRVSYQVQNTIMPLYMGQLGYSATIIGLGTTVCTIASLALRPLLGGMLDKYGRRILVLTGTALFAIATLLCGFWGSLVALLVLRALQGIGFSLHTTAVNTMATDVLPESRMAEGIGYLGLTGSVSSAIAPAIAMAFAAAAAYRSGFSVAFAAGLLAVFSLLLVKKPDVKASSQNNEGKQSHLSRLFEKKAIRPTIIMLMLGACNAGASTFLAIYALGRGFTEAQLSVYFTVSAIATVLARLFGGRLSLRIGKHPSILIATILSFVGYLLIPASGSQWVLWAAAALQGLSYGTIYPMMNAMAVTQSPPERRGTAMATFLTGMDIGIGFGASLCGLIIDTVGIDILFPMCAAVTVIVYVSCRTLLFPKAGSMIRRAEDPQ